MQSQIPRRLRLAAAEHDLTIKRYVLRAIEEGLREDLVDDDGGTGGLTASTDLLLAGLWDHRKDAAYDRP